MFIVSSLCPHCVLTVSSLYKCITDIVVCMTVARLGGRLTHVAGLTGGLGLEYFREKPAPVLAQSWPSQVKLPADTLSNH